MASGPIRSVVNAGAKGQRGANVEATKEKTIKKGH